MSFMKVTNEFEKLKLENYYQEKESKWPLQKQK